MVFQQHMIQVRFLANKLFSSGEQFKFVSDNFSDLSPKWILFHSDEAAADYATATVRGGWWTFLSNIFCNFVFEKKLICLLYSSYSGTYYRKSLRSAFFHLFNLGRSWNQEKDKFWICFLLSITKRIGRFSIPNMRSKYLPFFRWVLHFTSTLQTCWLLTADHDWLLITDQNNDKIWLVKNT